MKISFDLDGTAWKYRKEFGALAWLLKKAGHEIGILTAHGEELKDRDIHLWTRRGFPPPDFYYCHNRSEIPISEWKADTMSDEGIDLHFEDFDGGSYEKDMINSLTYGKVVRIV